MAEKRVILTGAVALLVLAGATPSHAGRGIDPSRASKPWSSCYEQMRHVLRRGDSLAVSTADGMIQRGRLVGFVGSDSTITLRVSGVSGPLLPLRADEVDSARYRRGGHITYKGAARGMFYGALAGMVTIGVVAIASPDDHDTHEDYFGLPLLLLASGTLGAVPGIVIGAVVSAMTPDTGEVPCAAPPEPVP